MRDTYGLPGEEGETIIEQVACPKCGAERYWPCTPLRETGHATCLRPHRERAWIAAGGSLPMPDKRSHR